jgi:hypothetical protein
MQLLVSFLLQPGFAVADPNPKPKHCVAAIALASSDGFIFPEGIAEIRNGRRQVGVTIEHPHQPGHDNQPAIEESPQQFECGCRRSCRGCRATA